MFQYKSNSLPVKRNLISNIANWLYESSQELPNDIRLIFFGKQEILANSQVWLKTQPSAESPLNKTNFDNSSQKNPQKQTTNARDTVQFYQISLLCFKYFVKDCLSKQIFGHGSIQSLPQFKFLTSFINFKDFLQSLIKI